MTGRSESPLSLMPRGLSRVEAARYVGVGPTLFDEMVKDGRMPPAKKINQRVVWDRLALDIFFDELPSEGAKGNDPFAFMDD